MSEPDEGADESHPRPGGPSPTAAPVGLVRGGRAYPVAVQPLDRLLVDTLDVRSESAPVDSALRAAGAAHLARLRARHPQMHDGPVLSWQRTSADDALVVALGGYFDAVATCDAVRADPSLAPAAHAAAGGDALTSGTGRVAALGVSVLLDVGEGVVVLGRRSARNAADVGLWHVAPSGMAEPAPQPGVDPLAATVATELEEELGLALPAAEVGARARVVGVVHDLARLRPDVVVHLPITPSEAAGLVAGEEFDDLVRVRPDERFWSLYGPEQLTPAAAGACALLDARRTGTLYAR